MLHEGEFDSVIVQQPHGVKTVDGPVPFDMDGFAFSAYLPYRHHVVFEEGQSVHGYIANNAVAEGTIDAVTLSRYEGRDGIRVSASPDDYTVDAAPHEIID